MKNNYIILSWCFLFFITFFAIYWSENHTENIIHNFDYKLELKNDKIILINNKEKEIVTTTLDSIVYYIEQDNL